MRNKCIKTSRTNALKILRIIFQHILKSCTSQKEERLLFVKKAWKEKSGKIFCNCSIDKNIKGTFQGKKLA